jgi:hypothetical protein
MYKITTLLLVAFMISSCKKSSDNNAQDNTPPANALLYWYCFLDGKPTNFAVVTGQEEDLLFYAFNDYSISPAGTDTSTFSYGYSLGKKLFYVPAFQIKRGTLILPGGGKPTDQEELMFWWDPRVAYSPGAHYGIEIKYIDAAGKHWSTSNGSQTASDFSFTDFTGYSTPKNYAVFTATFKCTLYNASGNKKELTGGRAKLRFETAE